jgi:dihydroceramidase
MSPKAKSAIVGLLRSGSILFVLGFAIWNVDNLCCDPLTRWKVAVGWPAAFFLEGDNNSCFKL